MEGERRSGCRHGLNARGNLVAVVTPNAKTIDTRLQIEEGKYFNGIIVSAVGPGIKAGHYDANVALNDLAPTLATLLAVETPAGSQGRVLTEMLAPAPAEHVSSTR